MPLTKRSQRAHRSPFESEGFNHSLSPICQPVGVAFDFSPSLYAGSLRAIKNEERKERVVHQFDAFEEESAELGVFAFSASVGMEKPDGSVYTYAVSSVSTAVGFEA
jgi:hypothetical protein